MSEEPRITMVDMEARLAADTSGAYRDEILNKVNGELQSVKRQIDGGLSPDDFAKANALRSALEAAGTVVPVAWAVQHKS